MFRNKDVSFLKSDALKLSWYEYFLLDMILMVVGILTLSLLVIVKCVRCCCCSNKKTKTE